MSGLRSRLMLAVLIAALLVATDAFSQIQSTNSLDRIGDLYKQNAVKWEQTLGDYAKSLFFLLAAIELSVTGFRLVLRGADFSEWVSELVNQILFIGFFLALLTNSSAWATAIVNSFRNAANQAAIAAGGTSNLAPSDVFSVGLSIATKLWDGVSLGSPINSIGLFIAALVLIICFAFIAANLLLALVESYIVISASVFFMGFGGSRWTKDYAVKMLTYAVSVGAKLFVLQLIIAIGQQIFNDLATKFNSNINDVFVVIGASIVMWTLTNSIPNLVQALINGSAAPGLHGSVGGAAMAAAGVQGAALTLKRSGQLASEQMTDAKQNGEAAKTSFGRAMQFTKFAAGNVAGAAMENTGARLSGRAPHHGGRFHQMADNLKGEVTQAQEKRKSAPNGPQAQPGGTSTGNSNSSPANPGGSTTGASAPNQGPQGNLGGSGQGPSNTGSPPGAPPPQQQP